MNGTLEHLMYPYYAHLVKVSIGRRSVMGKHIDLNGVVFGRLKVRLYLGESKWECVCTCGKTVKVGTCNLTSGNTKSCGCLRSDVISKYNAVRPPIHGYSYDTVYTVYKGIMSRCHNSKNPKYRWYGGRGIYVDAIWKGKPLEFIKWALTHGYVENVHLHRINNNKGYAPDNCKFLNKAAHLKLHAKLRYA